MIISPVAAPGAATEYSGIFSGRLNNVSGHDSAILGGRNNIVASGDSAILGGNGNTIPVAANNTFVAGSGINVGVVGIPNALHVNGLWANGLPVYPGFGPPYVAGTVFILPPLTAPPPGAAGVLWIQ